MTFQTRLGRGVWVCVWHLDFQPASSCWVALFARVDFLLLFLLLLCHKGAFCMQSRPCCQTWTFANQFVCEEGRRVHWSERCSRAGQTIPLFVTSQSGTFLTWMQKGAFAVDYCDLFAKYKTVRGKSVRALNRSALCAWFSACLLQNHPYWVQCIISVQWNLIFLNIGYGMFMNITTAHKWTRE